MRDDYCERAGGDCATLCNIVGSSTRWNYRKCTVYVDHLINQLGGDHKTRVESNLRLIVGSETNSIIQTIIFGNQFDIYNLSCFNRTEKWKHFVKAIHLSLIWERRNCWIFATLVFELRIIMYYVPWILTRIVDLLKLQDITVIHCSNVRGFSQSPAKYVIC